MAKSIIPLRPSAVVSGLTQDEQSALTWFVISGCSRKDAFVTFARPDMLASKAKAAIDEYVKQFFSRKECIAYIDAYRQTLDNFLNQKKEEAKVSGSLEERKAKAKTKLIEFAMSLADNIESADDPEFVLKMADKCNLLDSDEQIEEVPRRYLPTSCNSCSYRAFVEENAEWECPQCKYYKFGEDNGIHFEKENMLNEKVAE